jgi:hypothetical protein
MCLTFFTNDVQMFLSTLTAGFSQASKYLREHVQILPSLEIILRMMMENECYFLLNMQTHGQLTKTCLNEV